MMLAKVVVHDPDQIAARGEQIFDQGGVADHDRFPNGGKLMLKTSPGRCRIAASIRIVAVTNLMPCTALGTRGPGGIRTGSVVAPAARRKVTANSKTAELNWLRLAERAFDE
jgi:hypothetical protein